MDHENRIDGLAVPSQRAGRFLWRAACSPCQELGTFPHSGLEELDRARKSLSKGARSWWQRPFEQRRRLVERGLARLAAALEIQGSRLASGLGLDPDEIEPELRSVRKAGVRAARCAQQGPRGICLVRPDWRVSAGEFVGEATRSLLEGRVLLLFSDPRAPLLPELLLDSLLEAGLPCDAAALLHGPTDETLSLAIKAGLERLVTWGGRDEIAALRRLASGAGIPSQGLHLHRAQCDALPRGADAQDAAREIARRAFGRAATLSGWRGGQLATLYVHAREFSALSAALMECLLNSRDYSDPLPYLDPSAARQAREAWTLGLDEGATLIAGGEQRDSGRERRLLPTLMTNGNAHMRAARRIEPTGMLLLCRKV